MTEVKDPKILAFPPSRLSRYEGIYLPSEGSALDRVKMSSVCTFYTGMVL